MKVMREIVFDVLNREREYQIEKWGPTPDQGLHTPAEFLVYMQDYLTQAFNQATQVPPGILQTVSNPDESVLATIRKITAMGVACMEQWGAPDRDYLFQLPACPQPALPAAPPEVVAEHEAIAGTYDIAPEPPSADPDEGHAEPPDEIYPGWVELAAQEAVECDETCPTDCSVRAPVMKAIYDAYLRGFEEGDREDQGLEGY